jgi:hypothetical protein
VRVPSGEPELVRAGAAGDPAALAALWDAYGARVFGFCQRVLGRADAAADAAQDAFRLAHAQLGSLARSGESFGNAVFRAARTTSTLAELGAEAPAAASPRAAGAWATPRPRLSAALRGATLLGLAFAAPALTVSGSLRQRDALAGGVRLPDAARSLRVAGVPAAPAKHPARARERARGERPRPRGQLGERPGSRRPLAQEPQSVSASTALPVAVLPALIGHRPGSRPGMMRA